MSLLTTPQIASLWHEVQNNPQYEHSVTRLWMYLLREVFGFSGPDWNISAEQPPTGQLSQNKATASDDDKGDLERVDLQVEYFDTISYKFVVHVFLEAKRPAAGITEYDKLEFQALRDCLEYMQKNGLDQMYAVTVVGTTARLWECQPEDQYLQSFSPQESQHLSDKSAYLEIHSTDGAVLREQFAQMKRKIIDDALLRVQSRTLPQPLIVPSQPE